jgi:hypothetical protein
MLFHVYLKDVSDDESSEGPPCFINVRTLTKGEVFVSTLINKNQISVIFSNVTA